MFAHFEGVWLGTDNRLLAFCFVYSSKDKTKSDAIFHFIEAQKEASGKGRQNMTKSRPA